MKTTILLIVILIVPNLVLSQSDYRKGFIITSSQDTVYGFVNYRENDKAYEICEFKESEGLAESIYLPGQIIAYGFTGDRFFESREISKPDQEQEVVFLETIVRGAISLYKHKATYWIDKGKQTLYQLSNETKEEYINGITYRRESKQYIGILNMLLFDCPEIKSSIEKTRLGEKSLTELIERYNTCKGIATTIFKEKKPWVKSMVGIAGGITISQLNFDIYHVAYRYMEGSFEVSKSPVVGFSLDLLSPRISERFSFNAIVLYGRSKYYNFNIIEDSWFVERNYITVDLKQLKIPIGIRYTFPERKFTTFVNAGVSNTFHLNTNSSRVQELESNNIVHTFNNEAFLSKKNQLGFWGGVGILKPISNKLSASLEIRYEQTDGIVSSSAYSYYLESKLTNLQLFLVIKTK